MVSLNLSDALRTQALSQLGFDYVLTMPDVTINDLNLMAHATKDNNIHAKINQVAQSQADVLIAHYQHLQHAKGIIAYQGRQHFIAQFSTIMCVRNISNSSATTNFKKNT